MNYINMKPYIYNKHINNNYCFLFFFMIIIKLFRFVKLFLANYDFMGKAVLRIRIRMIRIQIYYLAKYSLFMWFVPALTKKLIKRKFYLKRKVIMQAQRRYEIWILFNNRTGSGSGSPYLWFAALQRWFLVRLYVLFSPEEVN